MDVTLMRSRKSIDSPPTFIKKIRNENMKNKHICVKLRESRIFNGIIICGIVVILYLLYTNYMDNNNYDGSIEGKYVSMNNNFGNNYDNTKYIKNDDINNMDNNDGYSKEYYRSNKFIEFKKTAIWVNYIVPSIIVNKRQIKYEKKYPHKKQKLGQYKWKKYSKTYNYVLIFLHGQKYSSKEWYKIGLLQNLAKIGISSFAIDIPGHGNSQKINTNIINGNNYDKSDWLYFIIQKLLDEIYYIHKFILILPSMSGLYGLNMVFHNKPIGNINMIYNKELIGLITVAPLYTDNWNENEWSNIRLPICIIYGENDKNLGIKSGIDLKHTINHFVVEIRNAGHACYLNNPTAFESGIIKFLENYL